MSGIIQNNNGRVTLFRFQMGSDHAHHNAAGHNKDQSIHSLPEIGDQRFQIARLEQDPTGSGLAGIAVGNMQLRPLQPFLQLPAQLGTLTGYGDHRQAHIR